jgi:hypothetical protein
MTKPLSKAQLEELITMCPRFEARTAAQLGALREMATAVLPDVPNE